LTPTTSNTNAQSWASRPTLTWAVEPAAGYTATVTGLDFTVYPNNVGANFSVSTTSGSRQVCPGMRYTTGSGFVCYQLAGDHMYTITVKDSGGQVVATKTATLTIVQPPIL